MWATTYLPPHPKRRLISAASPTTPLSTIEHLVLIDLLGAPRPRVRSYFPDTAWLFDVLASAETRLRDAGILDPAELGNGFFRARDGGDVSLGYMADDHLPFLRRGVSVLHIITEPFPRLWHTLGVSVCPPLPFAAARLSLSFFCSIADVVLVSWTGRRGGTPSPDVTRMEPHPSRVLCRISRTASRAITARRTVISNVSFRAREEIGL